MQTTLEQVITEISSLPPEDWARLRQWLEEQTDAPHKPKPKTENLLSETLEEEKFQLALSWIEENRSLYAGQWVALDGNRLISSGPSAVQVHQTALASGVAAPLLEHLPVDEQRLPFGGW